MMRSFFTVIRYSIRFVKYYRMLFTNSFIAYFAWLICSRSSLETLSRSASACAMSLVQIVRIDIVYVIGNWIK